MRTTTVTTELTGRPADGSTPEDGIVVHEPDGTGARSVEEGAVRALVDLRSAASSRRSSEPT
jgi:hypothetical protein